MDQQRKSAHSYSSGHADWALPRFTLRRMFRDFTFYSCILATFCAIAAVSVPPEHHRRTLGEVLFMLWMPLVIAALVARWRVVTWFWLLAPLMILYGLIAPVSMTIN